MGRPPVAQTPGLPPGQARQAGIVMSSKRPTEDPAEGCPGGWPRSTFVESVYPYLRRRTSTGNRVQNLMLDRSDDDLLVELVQYAEQQQEHWENYRAEIVGPLVP